MSNRPSVSLSREERSAILALPERGSGEFRRRRLNLVLCAMLGPALRDKHASWGPTFAGGVSKRSTTAVEQKIRRRGYTYCWFSQELWSHPSTEVEHMLVPQSRAKHGTRKLSRRHRGGRLPRPALVVTRPNSPHSTSPSTIVDMLWHNEGLGSNASGPSC
jgi:hypothetical protein